ncbi:MAG: hypothetical protein DI636_08925 [Pelagerythrobacter marensis]|nr:MAG: hypothetical protein DI636_08925 [Pelagerythrobacter marensis]PZU13942.1 MAG: hypothetical protein DI591_12625 [Citromicrobium sp.]
MDRDAGPEMAVLMAASRPPDPGRGAGTAAAGAGQGGGATPPSQRTPGPAEPAAAGRAAPVDPDRLFELARLNKMLGVLPLAPAALPPGCGGLAPRLLQVHLQTVAMNRRAMTVTLEVVEALRPLRHVVLKGPFQQLAVHGHANRRPSGDIDLYVAPRDRARAAALLEGLGFRPTEAERALWWIRFLGEQHFQRAADGAVVDLHHRLQQVGLPAWQRAGQVLDRAETRMQDGVAVPVPAAIDGCLLLAVQLAKALLAHEPCGWAVAELAHWLVQLTPNDWQRLWQAATAAGQDRTLALAMALVTACYGPLRLADGGPATPPIAAPRGLPDDPALLRDLVFQPWRRQRSGMAAPSDATEARPGATRRRQMLRMLAQGRPHVLVIEAARAVLSPLVLNRLIRRTETSGSDPRPPS